MRAVGGITRLAAVLAAAAFAIDEATGRLTLVPMLVLLFSAGRFFERATPGIAGARSITVSNSGAIVGGLEQAEEATLFAFEAGCRLRVKILKPRMRTAAE